MNKFVCQKLFVFCCCCFTVLIFTVLLFAFNLECYGLREQEWNVNLWTGLFVRSCVCFPGLFKAQGGIDNNGTSLDPVQTLHTNCTSLKWWPSTSKLHKHTNTLGRLGKWVGSVIGSMSCVSCKNMWKLFKMYRNILWHENVWRCENMGNHVDTCRIIWKHGTRCDKMRVMLSCKSWVTCFQLYW